MKLIETLLLILNRLILCCFWSIFYVYIAEMYPTRVRSLGYGWASATGMIGSTASPYIIFVARKVGINSWIPPGVIGMLCWLTIFVLPETHRLPLKD